MPIVGLKIIHNTNSPRINTMEANSLGMICKNKREAYSSNPAASKKCVLQLDVSFACTRLADSLLIIRTEQTYSNQKSVVIGVQLLCILYSFML